MKISISLGGRFHAFYLAKFLQDKDMLHQLATSYPKFEVKKYGIEKRKILSLITKEIFQRGYKMIFGRYPSSYFLLELFDKNAAKKIAKDADIYIIWAGFALHTLKVLRKENPKAIIIIERCSSHIEEQAALLEKVYNKPIVDSRIIEKELEEYDLADYISLPGQFAKKTFLDRGFSPEKLIVNNFGVNLSEFEPKKVMPKEEGFTIGYAGTLSARKNIVGLIKAVEILTNKGLNINLKLIGPIDKKTFDRTILDKHSFVKYNPPVPQAELINFYNTLDCFILNSIEDGFGYVLLQAMACGIPAIASTNSGGPDVITEGENGFIIPIERSDILAERIQWMFEHPNETKEMGQNALKQVKTGFTWDDYNNRALDILKNIKRTK